MNMLDINKADMGLQARNRILRTQPEGCTGNFTFVDSSYMVEDERDFGTTPHMVTEKTVLGGQHLQDGVQMDAIVTTLGDA